MTGEQEAIIFPPQLGGTEDRRQVTTGLVLEPDEARLPLVRWIGPLTTHLDAASVAAAVTPHRGAPLLIEHSRGVYTRPGLRGHRIAVRGADSAAQVLPGRDWSTAMRTQRITADDQRLVIEAVDPVAALTLRTEVEALPGGALRARHTLTNTGDSPYLLEGLEITVPLPDDFTEFLDFTGRHERERSPQRHLVRDGLWLRENRRGRTGLEAASVLVAGTPGFTCTSGKVLGVHVAWSGNCVLRLERDPASTATIGGGELLLPGEVLLATGAAYSTPWVFVAASVDGLDGLAAAFHGWLRSLPAHPERQPVTLNVWEAVYFDHDMARLRRLAELAARVGVERYVLDDGWFHLRRDDHAGLGDWWVDPTVWPDGLTPLIDHVHALGMTFGLWIEPEMVNPDSDLYRAHPDWILAIGQRLPLPQRNQYVLDLANPDVRAYLFDRLDALLTENAVEFVKWDHNRDLHEAGRLTDGGSPGLHAQAAGHYELLDALRAKHPDIAWESCSSGGGRVDLGVLERVQRVWTSDMTDALARQQIQRWTVQFVAPEYLGAHVSAPTSHQTRRTLPLDFRAATALFGSYGIEWDLTTASDEELDRLAEWTDRYKRYRPLLHSGRTVRPESPDPAVLLHGVVAADRTAALIAHVQLDEPTSNRGVVIRIPHLEPATRYHVRWEGPVDAGALSRVSALDPRGPTGGVPVTGAVLAQVGIWIPRRRPETVTLVDLRATH